MDESQREGADDLSVQITESLHLVAGPVIVITQNQLRRTAILMIAGHFEKDSIICREFYEPGAGLIIGIS